MKYAKVLRSENRAGTKKPYTLVLDCGHVVCRDKASKRVRCGWCGK